MSNFESSNFQKNEKIMNENFLSNGKEIDLLDEYGHTLVKFCQSDETHSSRSLQASEISSRSISQFNHLLELMPSSASALAGNSKKLMTCTFDYGKLVQAKDGSGAIGAVCKEGSSKIGAQARFHDAKNIGSVVTTGLILNIASQMLAQKHLADINERLKSIEEQIKGVREFLEQSRLAKIKVFQEHLHRVGMLIEDGEHIHHDTLHLLAQKAQEVRAEVAHVRDNLNSAHKELQNFDGTSWFGSDDLRVTLSNKIDRINYFQREYLLGMQCLIMANLILFIKNGGNKEFVIAGEGYLKELTGEQGLLNQWGEAVKLLDLHLSKMKPIFELAKSTQANAQIIKGKVEKIQQLIAQDSEKIIQIQQRLMHAQNPCVVLEIKNRQVIRGHYMS